MNKKSIDKLNKFKLDILFNNFVNCKNYNFKVYKLINKLYSSGKINKKDKVDLIMCVVDYRNDLFNIISKSINNELNIKIVAEDHYLEINI